MIRMKNETFAPVSIELSSLEIEMLLMAIEPGKFTAGLYNDAATDLRQRLVDIKEQHVPKTKYVHLPAVRD